MLYAKLCVSFGQKPINSSIHTTYITYKHWPATRTRACKMCLYKCILYSVCWAESGFQLKVQILINLSICQKVVSVFWLLSFVHTTRLGNVFICCFTSTFRQLLSLQQITCNCAIFYVLLLHNFACVFFLTLRSFVYMQCNQKHGIFLRFVFKNNLNQIVVIFITGSVS